MALHSNLQCVVAGRAQAEVGENLLEVGICAACLASGINPRILVDDDRLVVGFSTHIGQSDNRVMADFMFDRDVPTLRDTQMEVLGEDRPQGKWRCEGGIRRWFERGKRGKWADTSSARELGPGSVQGKGHAGSGDTGLRSVETIGRAEWADVRGVVVHGVLQGRGEQTETGPERCPWQGVRLPSHA